MKQGDVIRTGDPFTTVIRNGQLLARIDLPARFRNRVRTDMAVLLEEPGSSRPLARGVVVSIDPSVKAGSQELLFAGIGAVLGWFTPPIFAGFNGLYGRAERGYARCLAWVLGNRRLVMTALAAGSACRSSSAPPAS